LNHADHVRLLRDGVPSTGGVWADLGSGWGAFTLALAELLGPGGRIYSVDKDRGALHRQRSEMEERYPAVAVEYVESDFTRQLDLPPLDGIVMANALHYVRDKLPLLERLRDCLTATGRLILVEYDTDRGNHWVPYPLAYPTWEQLARDAGFRDVRLLTTHPSSFLGRFYSSLAAR
jgi:ubiquinone/menaquinone biosynthesis C-methylase UbiE